MSITVGRTGAAIAATRSEDRDSHEYDHTDETIEHCWTRSWEKTTEGIQDREN